MVKGGLNLIIALSQQEKIKKLKGKLKREGNPYVEKLYQLPGKEIIVTRDLFAVENLQGFKNQNHFKKENRYWKKPHFSLFAIRNCRLLPQKINKL